MKLAKANYQWALKHIVLEGDTDLFPPPFEIDVLAFQRKAVIEALANIDIGSYAWRGGRRFVVPKGAMSFRTATQLDPIDNLVLVALIKKFGPMIEAARVDSTVAFSYRFDPSSDGRIYGTESRWQSFWEACQRTMRRVRARFVAIADIADYYNQIYHHTIENELRAAGLPNEVVNAVLRLLQVHTEKVSRGIPIGPHATHLLAELAFNPIDRALASEGLTFCRYVDDVHFFCRTEEDARIALYKYAEIIDDQQRLTLQDRKTEIVPATEYATRASNMLLNQPLNDDEAEILSVIAKAAGADYDDVSLEDMTEDELEYFESDTLEELFEIYFQHSPVPFSRLGWLLRRLSHVKAPGAMMYVLQWIEYFQPVLGDAVRYIQNASSYFDGDWELAGQYILDALELPIVKNSPYIQMSLLNLFSRVPEFNHIDLLTSRFAEARSEAQREIVSAAVAAGAAPWLRTKKAAFRNADTWQRRALLTMAGVLPGDEGRFWKQSVLNSLTGLERCTVEWGMKRKLSGDVSF
jgi:hypothetical protein